MLQKIKEKDFIQRQYGCFRSKEMFQVDNVDEKLNGVWAHRVRVDEVGSQWIPMTQVRLCNDQVLKLSISAEDADYLAKSHNTRLDHKATKEWLSALNDGRDYPVVLLRNALKRKEIFVSNAGFYRTILYSGKPPKKTINVRIVFGTFLRIKV